MSKTLKLVRDYTSGFWIVRGVGGIREHTMLCNKALSHYIYIPKTAKTLYLTPVSKPSQHTITVRLMITEDDGFYGNLVVVERLWFEVLFFHATNWLKKHQKKHIVHVRFEWE